MSELLTDAELVNLTGSENRQTQKSILNKNGIRYIVGANGRLSVTWTAVNYVLTGRTKKTDDNNINWDALNVA